MSIALALETLFSDPIIAAQGVYTSSAGPSANVRVIVKRGEEVWNPGTRVGIITAKAQGEILASDLAASGIDPTGGDQLEIAGRTYRVATPLLQPPEALVWLVGLV